MSEADEQLARQAVQFGMTCGAVEQALYRQMQATGAIAADLGRVDFVNLVLGAELTSFLHGVFARAEKLAQQSRV